MTTQLWVQGINMKRNGNIFYLVFIVIFLLTFISVIAPKFMTEYSADHPEISIFAKIGSEIRADLQGVKSPVDESKRYQSEIDALEVKIIKLRAKYRECKTTRVSISDNEILVEEITEPEIIVPDTKIKSEKKPFTPSDNFGTGY